LAELGSIYLSACGAIARQKYSHLAFFKPIDALHLAVAVESGL